MIASEEILEEVFAQIPPVNYGGKLWPVRFEWGDIDDLNLYLVDVIGNKTPLIWLVQGDDEQPEGLDRSSYTRRVRLMIAKSSEHRENRNPTVWATEFKEVLNPLLNCVISALSQSGKTQIVVGTERVKREANYSEYSRNVVGEDRQESVTIDCWNVISYTADIIFSNYDNCLPTFYFNT